MVDTAGTLTAAANLMMERGALSVRAICTHPVLSGNAYKRIEESQLLEMIVTDTIPLKKDQIAPKITVVSSAELFADVLKSVNEYKSISSKFLM